MDQRTNHIWVTDKMSICEFQQRNIFLDKIALQ